MKQSYPNSTECSMAILKEYYGWNDSVEYRNPMNYIENFLKQYNKYFRYKISDDGFVINDPFKLIDEVKILNGAWETIYKNNKHKKETIPIALIKKDAIIMREVCL